MEIPLANTVKGIKRERKVERMKEGRKRQARSYNQSRMKEE